MGNHKQFAYAGEMINTPVTMLGFYSKHHQSIFTHHTTFMHVHLLDDKTKTVGHLDELQIKGLLTIYLPEK
jgi:acetolactate decarboxylase